MLGHLAYSFASFSVVAVRKHSKHYHDYSFSVGIIASTAGDLIKLSYDAIHTCYDLMIGKDFATTEAL